MNLLNHSPEYGKHGESIACNSLECNCFDQTDGTSSQRVAKKLSEANELGPPEPTVMLPISHQPPVGIELYVEDIVGYINGGEGNIIGIYGMGGVRKITMLKSIQQHYLPKHTIFDRVIWVMASKDWQLKRLQMDIAKSLELMALKESDKERTCGDKLFSYLKNKNCLLLLDDIWEHVDLQLLGMAHSATERGQQQPRKVMVFMTRSETVCAQMKAEKKIKVRCLDSEQAWQLFEQNSDGDVLSSDARIKFLAEELAKECAGLPLALVTVARAMSGKRSWEAWNDALHQIRDKHEWTTIALLEDSLVMYKAFKLNYDSCGIIHKFNVINEAFAKGCFYLEALVTAFLLEKCSDPDFPFGDTNVKMHDVIRDMILLMVSGLEGNKRKWIVKQGIGLSDLPTQQQWQEAERASFMMNDDTMEVKVKMVNTQMSKSRAEDKDNGR
ncbi:probable disease resistance protein At4g14610 [Zingiber officinale]|uniref:probable disease resistance protein At4g14610 n=1 Tax=Zingiber officinale TaxID=94328 RepID=UPI001C4AD7AA|nr:probable disease resistance protein At4g14610 [Zingiber officinale]